MTRSTREDDDARDRPGNANGRPESPREATESERLVPGDVLFAAREAPDEPAVTRRADPTATRTLRDGEIQGHPRDMPGDRDSK
jgi:hypothetical protein